MSSTSEHGDDWLLTSGAATSGTATATLEPEPEPQQLPQAIPVPATVQPTDVRPVHSRSVVATVGLVAAGLVVGVVGTFALGHHGSSSSQQPNGTFQQNGFPPGFQNGTGQNGQLQNGNGFQGGPMQGGPMMGGPMTGQGSTTQQTQPGGVVTG